MANRHILKKVEKSMNDVLYIGQVNKNQLLTLRHLASIPDSCFLTSLSFNIMQLNF